MPRPDQDPRSELVDSSRPLTTDVAGGWQRQGRPSSVTVAVPTHGTAVRGANTYFAMLESSVSTDPRPPACGRPLRVVVEEAGDRVFFGGQRSLIGSRCAPRRTRADTLLARRRAQTATFPGRTIGGGGTRSDAPAAPAGPADSTPATAPWRTVPSGSHPVLERRRARGQQVKPHERRRGTDGPPVERSCARHGSSRHVRRIRRRLRQSVEASAVPP